jgi:cell division protein FtsN
MAQQEEIDKQSNTSYVVSQTQPEVHTETTQVVDLTPTPYTPTNSTEKPKEQNQIQAEPTKAEKPIEKPKTEPKKPEQSPTTLTKPKTLEQKPNVTQTVLNKSDFQTYVIQVGAFSTKEEAEIMKNRVSQIPAVSKFKVVIEYFPAKNLHKVLVEYFENADSARTTCTELKKANVQCFATKI